MSKEKSTAGNMIWIVTALLFAFIVFGLIASHLRSKASSEFTTCLGNLKNVSRALTEFHEKNNKYPSKLSKLVPEYLSSIPECIGAKKDTYSEGYQVSEDLQVFTLTCHGNHHSDVGAVSDYPRYYSKYGLVFHKSSELTPIPTPSTTLTPVLKPSENSDNKRKEGDNESTFR